jgi:hypothetical protein
MAIGLIRYGESRPINVFLTRSIGLASALAVSAAVFALADSRDVPAEKPERVEVTTPITDWATDRGFFDRPIPPHHGRFIHPKIAQAPAPVIPDSDPAANP